MKANQIVLMSGVAAGLVGAPLGGQTPSATDFATAFENALAQVEAAEAADDGGAESQELLRKYEKELADLNAATQRRRAELMKKLAEVRSRQAAEARAKSFLNGQREAALLLTGVPSQPTPEWIIGVEVEKQEGDARGVKIRRVFEGKPAEKAGLKAEDVILECNGIKLRDRNALVQILQAAQDQSLNLKVQRSADEGEPADLEVQIAAVKNEAAIDKKAPSAVIPHPGFPQNRVWPNLVQPPGVPPPHPYEFLNQWPRPSLEQLHQDNAEIQTLLKTLIEEVKKLRKD